MRGHKHDEDELELLRRTQRAETDAPAVGEPHPHTLSPSAVQRLQASAGNSATARLVQGQVMQRESLGQKVKAAGEQDETDMAAILSSSPPDAFTVSNVKDRGGAVQLIGRIRSQEGLIGEKGWTNKLEENHKVIEALDSFASFAEQDQVVGDLFRPAYAETKTQYARMEGMFEQLWSAFPPKDGAATGGAMADLVATAGTRKPADQAATALQTPGAGDPVKTARMERKKAEISMLMKGMDQGRLDLQGTVDPILTSVRGVNDAQVNIDLGPLKRENSPDLEQAEAAAKKVEADLAAAKEGINTIVKVVQIAGTAVGGLGAMGALSGQLGAIGTKTAEKAVSLSGTIASWGDYEETGRRAKGQVAEGAGARVTGAAGSAGKGAMSLGSAVTGQDGGKVVTDEIAMLMVNYRDRLKAAQGHLSAVKDQALVRQVDLAVNQLETARQNLFDKVAAFTRELAKFEKQQQDLRKSVDELSADAGPGQAGQPDLGMVVRFQAESTIFVQSCERTLELGRREKDKREKTKEAKAAVGGRNVRQGVDDFGQAYRTTEGGMVYWMAYKPPQPEFDTPRIDIYPGRVSFNQYAKADANQTTEDIDRELELAVKEVEGWKVTAAEFAKRMSEITGLG